MTEEWREIPQTGGKYWVSNFGRIRGPLKLRKLKPHPTGYIGVGIKIKKGNKYVAKFCQVHRLVAQAFIPNPKNKPDVNHIDGNKRNNCVKNLEWVTEHENNIHARDLLGHKFSIGRKNKGRPVRCIETGEVFPTGVVASRHCGLSDSKVGGCVNNPKRNHTAGGYHWEYA